MRCELPYHAGDRDVRRLRIFFRDGKKVEGCVQCTDHLLTSLYPTTKRLRTMPDGKQFWISPAHVRDIKQRRVAPDLSGYWRDKKGIGSAMRY